MTRRRRILSVFVGVDTYVSIGSPGRYEGMYTYNTYKIHTGRQGMARMDTNIECSFHRHCAIFLEGRKYLLPYLGLSIYLLNLGYLKYTKHCNTRIARIRLS